MSDETELIDEAKQAEAFIRKLELTWIDLKEKTKEAKEEYDQAVMHLRALFADEDRPLLADQDELPPSSVSFGKQEFEAVKEIGEIINRNLPKRIKRPRGASKR